MSDDLPGGVRPVRRRGSVEYYGDSVDRYCMSHRVVSWLLTVSAIVVALCVAIVTLPLARYPNFTTTGGAGSVTYVSAIATTSDLAAPAAATVSWSPRRTVTAVGLSGSVVTAVFVRPGKRLHCGSKVFEVDASPIFALCGPQPLWRVVSGGESGTDVNEVVGFLRSRGWLASLHPSSASLTTGIQRWQRAADLPVTGRFYPASVVWVGSPLVPDVVDVYVDEPVTATMQVLTSGAVISSARVSPVPVEGNRRWVFNVSGLPMTTAVSASGAVRDLASLTRMINATLQPGSPLPTTVQGEIRLSSPLPVLALPVSAVITSQTSTCVAVQSRAGPRTVPITVVDSQLGSVFVTGVLRNGEQVLSDPLDQKC